MSRHHAVRKIGIYREMSQQNMAHVSRVGKANSSKLAKLFYVIFWWRIRKHHNSYQMNPVACLRRFSVKFLLLPFQIRRFRKLVVFRLLPLRFRYSQIYKGLFVEAAYNKVFHSIALSIDRQIELIATLEILLLLNIATLCWRRHNQTKPHHTEQAEPPQYSDLMVNFLLWTPIMWHLPRFWVVGAAHLSCASLRKLSHVLIAHWLLKTKQPSTSATFISPTRRPIYIAQ